MKDGYWISQLDTQRQEANLQGFLSTWNMILTLKNKPNLICLNLYDLDTIHHPKSVMIIPVRVMSGSKSRLNKSAKYMKNIKSLVTAFQWY